MTPALNQVDGDALLRNTSDDVDYLSGFHEDFEHEYQLFLAVHTVVPPLLLSFNFVGTAFTLACRAVSSPISQERWGRNARYERGEKKERKEKKRKKE